jgi:galactonate dehydratase
MIVRTVETLHCDAGWRPWSFLKIVTDTGLVGYSEVTDSHGSPRGIAGIVEDLAPLVIGQDPRATEKIYWNLYRATRQSPGSIIQKALGGIENALLDIKAKDLGIPVYELFGGPVRNHIRAYWSHCGTTRARAWEVTQTPKLDSYDAVTALGREVVEKGFTILKTNIVTPGDKPSVYMPGFQDQLDNETRSTRSVVDSLTRLMDAFRRGTGKQADIILDLNFNFKTKGNVKIAKAMEPYDLMWLEVDSFDPSSLAYLKSTTPRAVATGENLYTTRQFKPFFEQHAMDIAVVDVIWNGFAQSKKIADLAEIHEMSVAPHNYYSHLATMISAHFCAAVSNSHVLEVDVDDVPWKDQLVTRCPRIEKGCVVVPDAPGWGTDLREDVLKEHPWPRQ